VPGARKVIGVRAAREFRRRQEQASERRDQVPPPLPRRESIRSRLLARVGLLAGALVATIMGRRVRG
jgi:hypothetical protein